MFLVIKKVVVFSSVFKTSVNYSSHNFPLEGPTEVRKEKESIPLCKALLTFSPSLKFTRKTFAQNSFCIISVLEQKRSLTNQT